MNAVTSTVSDGKRFTDLFRTGMLDIPMHHLFSPVRLLLVCAAVTLIPATLLAQSFEADLGQTLDWLEMSSPGPRDVPADAYELTRHPMPEEPVRLLLDEVPGKPFNVVDPPPTKRLYYKYPIYTVLGLPRDLIDGAVGMIGFVPIINLPIVGVGYELVPTQVVFRDHRDWHGYGGTRNKNGHGWIDSDNWGWFPNLNQTKFRKIDERKLEKYKAENAKLASELESLNREIDAKNQAIRDRQQTARDYALYWIEQGDGREAVSWILPAHRSYPLEEDLQGVLVAALAFYADDPEAPDWVEPLLWDKLTSALSRVQRSAESRLVQLRKQYPQAFSPVRALVYFRTLRGDLDDALEVAAESFQLDPEDPARARLYFETALTARQPEAAAVALAELETSNPERPGIELLAEQLEQHEDGLEMLRIRLGLLKGDAGPAREFLEARMNRAPADPYAHYYLGVSELVLAEAEANLAEHAPAATRHFEQSSLLADLAPHRLRSKVALTYMQALSGERREREDATSSGFATIDF